jgi:hypothetical protein
MGRPGQGARELWCGWGDLARPGGVRPAGLVGTGEDGGPPAGGVADEPGPAEGEGDGARPRRGAVAGGLITPPPGPAPSAAPTWSDAAPEGRGATQRVNGACGPPAIATTTAPRQAASATAVPRPTRRMIRRRRPDGSANTASDSTARSVTMSNLGQPGNGRFGQRPALPRGSVPLMGVSSTRGLEIMIVTPSGGPLSRSPHRTRETLLPCSHQQPGVVRAADPRRARRPGQRAWARCGAVRLAVPRRRHRPGGLRPQGQRPPRC